MITAEDMSRIVNRFAAGKRRRFRKQTSLRDGVRHTHISTVWLGYDASHGDAEPLWYETMVFGGFADGLQFRWRNKHEAKKGHRIVVRGIYLGIRQQRAEEKARRAPLRRLHSDYRRKARA